jgi:hypothetical protein
MSKNHKKAPPAVDRATPSIAKPTVTDAQKVTAARDIVATAKKNPGWATAKDLQAAAAVWSQSADDIEANAAVVVARRSDLRTAEAKQRSLRRAWRAARPQVLGAVDVLCAGSADELKAYGFGVRNHAGLGPLAVTENLATAPGTALGAAVSRGPRPSAVTGSSCSMRPTWPTRPRTRRSSPARRASSPSPAPRRARA